MSITEYVGIGGPVGLIFMFLGFLLNAYLTKKKDDREDVRIERESETGIVETTKQALSMAREEMTAVALARIDERKENATLIAALKEESNRTEDQLRYRLEACMRENRELALENAQLRGLR